MRADEQKLAMALRGGLRGRFQNSFHLLENAFEVLDERMMHCVTPTEYDTLLPLLRQIQEQLQILHRLGEHAADAAVAPVLQQLCTPHPMELIGQLREWCALFEEIVTPERQNVTARVQTSGNLSVLLTMGDDTLLGGLLANLLSNSLAADGPIQITLACAPGTFCYTDNGPGLSEDARELLAHGQWSSRLLEQGGLGLPLIRAYAAAMGWQLTVGEGPGTCVRFALPPCAVDLGEMVLESAGAKMPLQEQRRQYLRRELRPVLPTQKEE